MGHTYDDLLCIKFEGKNEYYQNMYLIPVNAALNKYKDCQFEYLVD